MPVFVRLSGALLVLCRCFIGASNHLNLHFAMCGVGGQEAPVPGSDAFIDNFLKLQPLELFRLWGANWP